MAVLKTLSNLRFLAFKRPSNGPREESRLWEEPRLREESRLQEESWLPAQPRDELRLLPRPGLATGVAGGAARSLDRCSR